MKKLHLLILCTTICLQQVQSMDNSSLALTESKNDKDNWWGYPINYEPFEKQPQPIIYPTETNPFSEQLYANDINENDIENLVKQGAVINYETITKRFEIPWSIPLYYAFNGTEQGVKNMKKIIALGAALHNFPNNGGATPLGIAVDKNHNEMIQLLMPYEKAEVTIYQDDESKINSPTGQRSNNMEKRIRDHIIKRSFYNQNINSIQLLLKLGLMSADRGLTEFTYYMKPNKDIFNLLIEHGANNADNALVDVANDAFPNNISYIDFFEQQCNTGVFNEEVLQKMLTIQAKVNNIVQALEQNKNIKPLKKRKQEKK